MLGDEPPSFACLRVSYVLIALFVELLAAFVEAHQLNFLPKLATYVAGVVWFVSLLQRRIARSVEAVVSLQRYGMLLAESDLKLGNRRSSRVMLSVDVVLSLQGPIFEVS